MLHRYMEHLENEIATNMQELLRLMNQEYTSGECEIILARLETWQDEMKQIITHLSQNEI